MRVLVLFLLVAMQVLAYSGGVGVAIKPPAGWPVWTRSAGQEVFLAPDPEIEEVLLRVYRTPSVSLRGTLAGELREAVRGRSVVRISPEHHATNEDGLSVLAKVVISEESDGVRRHTMLAAVQGVRVAVLLHFETSSAERLSQHFQTVMNAAAAVRFPD